MFPSFGIDGYLYFSTNGRAGLGGLDIYKVKLKLLGGDDEIVHMPSPINSRHDDYGFIVFADSISGSFISKRNGDDISYAYEYNETFPEEEAQKLKNSKLRFNVFKLNRIKLLNPTASIVGSPRVKPLKSLAIKKEQILKLDQALSKRQIQQLQQTEQEVISKLSKKRTTTTNEQQTKQETKKQETKQEKHIKKQ